MVRCIRLVAVMLPLVAAIAQAQMAGDATHVDSVPAVDSTHMASMRPLHAIRWYEAAAVAGGIGLSFTLDNTIRNSAQANRNSGRDDAASVLRRVGQPEVYLPVGLGVIAVGLIADRPAITRAGIRISSSVAAAGLSTELLKYGFGRSRPYEGLGNTNFQPFTTNASMPSGHTAVAFALATSISHEIHNTWATVGLFTIATGTAASRINDDKHWFSDTVFGAVIGVTAAQIMERRWSLFGIRAPMVFAGPGGTTLGWHATF